MARVCFFCRGFGSTPSRERMTARSTKFCNSRMLPGQEYHCNAAMVSGRNAADLLPHTAAKHLHEMRYKNRDVFPALSEGRQQDGKDVQTIVQITTKLPASH